MKLQNKHTYVNNERYPVEYLVFTVDPADVEEFLKVDHEVWTIMEAYMEGLDRIPFLSKEVWLNDNKPGEITVVMVWESLEQWFTVGEESFQKKLISEFDARFKKPNSLKYAMHEQEKFGVHRVSRFERI